MGTGADKEDGVGEEDRKKAFVIPVFIMQGKQPNHNLYRGSERDKNQYDARQQCFSYCMSRY